MIMKDLLLPKDDPVHQKCEFGLILEDFIHCLVRMREDFFQTPSSK